MRHATRLPGGRDRSARACALSAWLRSASREPRTSGGLAPGFRFWTMPKAPRAYTSQRVRREDQETGLPIDFIRGLRLSQRQIRRHRVIEDRLGAAEA